MAPGNREQEKLVIVTGADGALGRAFLDHYAQDPNATAVGVYHEEVRRRVDGVRYVKCDLSNALETRTKVQRLEIPDGIDGITFIHAVGGFKFEEDGPEIDADGDGIDDNVYRANVETFEYFYVPLARKLDGQPLTLTMCSFGSISDEHDVPYWRSYSRSKLRLREFMLREAEKENVRGRFISLSSTKTENEERMRPHADQTFWLEPGEIVAYAAPLLSDDASWREGKVFKPSPHYSPDLFTNHEVLLERWRRRWGETSFSQRELFKNSFE